MIIVIMSENHHFQGGGESRDQLYKRCTSSLQRIAEKHRGNVLGNYLQH